MKSCILAMAVAMSLVTSAFAHNTPERSVIAMVDTIAVQEGVSPALAHAIVRKESNYDCHAGHGGIMQVNAQTARSVGVGSTRSCYGGLLAGMRYLRRAIEVHGSGCAAFSAYQSGLGIHRCSAYGRSIMSMMHQGPPTHVVRSHVHRRHIASRHRIVVARYFRHVVRYAHHHRFVHYASR